MTTNPNPAPRIQWVVTIDIEETGRVWTSIHSRWQDAVSTVLEDLATYEEGSDAADLYSILEALTTPTDGWTAQYAEGEVTATIVEVV